MADKAGMSVADMKKLLVRSKSEPVNCALGVNGQAAVLQLDKLKQPRSLEKVLEADFPEVKNLRFGRAMVDIEEDPKLVKFYLNKPISGMARRLVKTLKGTGFTKAKIMLDDGTLVEDAEEAEEEVQAGAPGAPVAPGAVPPPPGPPPMAEAKADPAALQKALAALIPQIPSAAGTDPTRKAALAKLAGDANTNIKTGNLVYAATYIEQLKKAIEEGPPAAAGAGTIAKSRLAWVATRQRIEADLGKLGAELAKTYADVPQGAEVASKFKDRIAPLLATFDGALPDLLDQAAQAADPAARSKAIAAAQEQLQKYQDYVSKEKLLDDLDDNPFVPLGLRSTLTATISGLAKALH